MTQAIKSVVLFKLNEPTTEIKIINYFRVVNSYRIIPKGRSECWLVEYINEGLENPDSDPVLIGIQNPGTGIQSRIVWQDNIWRSATPGELRGLLNIAKLYQTKQIRN